MTASLPRLLLLAAAASLLAPAAHADEIVLRGGRSVSGVQVVGESYESIQYKAPGVGSVQSQPTPEVRQIRYSRTPANARAADEARDTGSLIPAAELYLAVAEDSSVDAHHRANAYVEAGDAMLAAGHYQGAVEAYDALLAAFPKTRHLGRALLGKGRAALSGGDHAAASAAFERLASEASSKRLGEQWVLDAEFWGLVAADQAGKREGLAEKLAALRQRAAGNYQDIANKCALHMARVQFKSGKIDAAEALFQEIIDNRLDSGDEIAAGAFNGRGRSRFARAQEALSKGDGARAQQLYHEALLDFLRVHVSYPDVPSEHPEALYWAAESFRNLPDLDDADLRARQLQALLERDFGKSVWAKKSAES